MRPQRHCHDDVADGAADPTIDRTILIYSDRDGLAVPACSTFDDGSTDIDDCNFFDDDDGRTYEATNANLGDL